MDYPEKEGSSSLYNYSDKSIPQAGYAAIVYAVISMLTTGLSWFRAPTTPWLALVIVALVIGGFFGGLAFGIFRKSRVAVVVMLVFVVGLQLYTWFVLRSISGTLLSIVVTGFLLRGARRIFQDHAERETSTGKT
jgi:quinol-cytochrome oxidoreductase complex cytochrome b subunit